MSSKSITSTLMTMSADVVRRLDDSDDRFGIALRGLDTSGHTESLANEIGIIEALLRPVDLGLLEEVLQVPERIRVEGENEENLAFTVFLPVRVLHGDVEVWIGRTFLLSLLYSHNSNRLNALWPWREAGVRNIVQVNVDEVLFCHRNLLVRRAKPAGL